ncbi:hypothetical protein HAX54_047553 [Datura stramonium]|uniref:Uncharacterized protein n=1 Tax=Datura stramonium TaxID=4076 RepID=A0ABS8RQ75_DATST|nr:hypothetical protein [Datura stramonium]
MMRFQQRLTHAADAHDAAGGHGFEQWKQSLVEMQGKAAYNRPLRSGPSPELGRLAMVVSIRVDEVDFDV